MPYLFFRENIFLFRSAPQRPSDKDVTDKIRTDTTSRNTEPTRYIIDIDNSLFSNNFGPLKKYVIYVRQSKKRFSPKAKKKYVSIEI